MNTFKKIFFFNITFLLFGPSFLESSIGNDNEEITHESAATDYSYNIVQYGKTALLSQSGNQCNYQTLWNLNNSFNRDNPKEKKAPQKAAYQTFYSTLRDTLIKNQLTNGKSDFIQSTCLSWFIRKNNLENHVFMQPEISIDALLKKIDPKIQLQMLYDETTDLQALNPQKIVNNIKFNFIHGDWVYWIIDTKTDADKSSQAGHVILIATKLIKISTGKNDDQKGKITIEIFDSLMNDMLSTADSNDKHFIEDYFIVFLEKFMRQFKTLKLPQTLEFPDSEQKNKVDNLFWQFKKELWNGRVSSGNYKQIKNDPQTGDDAVSAIGANDYNSLLEDLIANIKKNIGDFILTNYQQHCIKYITSTPSLDDPTLNEEHKIKILNSLISLIETFPNYKINKFLSDLLEVIRKKHPTLSKKTPNSPQSQVSKGLTELQQAMTYLKEKLTNFSAKLETLKSNLEKVK